MSSRSPSRSRHLAALPLAVVTAIAVGTTFGTEVPVAEASVAAASISTGPAATSGPRDPADGGRVVRHFDFEELELVPVRLPRPWQNLAAELGLPSFGDWAVRNDRAAGGNWALRLDPDGMPMAFGIPSGVLLVHPMTDYRVRSRVRTEGLDHGRVQLVAMLCDADGRTIPGSTVRSPAVRSPDRWSTIEVTAGGRFPSAVSLRVELHLLQPERPDPTLDPVAAARPTLVDVSGSAWFDDVVVEHRSRVDMTTDAANGVTIAPGPPTLSISVHDLTTAGLAADLRVRDADGRTVHRARIDRLRSGAVIRRELPLERHGWFEATLTVLAPEGPVGERTIPFAWVAPPARSGVPGPGRLGVAVDTNRIPATGDLAGMITATGARLAILPVWPSDDPRIASIPAVVDHLLQRGLEVVAELAAVRRDLAAAAGLDPHQVAAFLASGPEGWRDELEPLIVDFGLRVDRWTIGPRRGPGGAPIAMDPADVAPATARLTEALPAPIAVLPRSATSIGGRDGADEVLMSIPAAATPESIPAWIDPAHGTVELRLPEFTTARDAEIDLALRVLHAWRGGARTVVVPLPSLTDAGPGGAIAPGPTLPALRVLADGLQGRRVVGELRLGEGIEAWLLAGEDPRDGALVTWRTGRANETPAPVAVRLGAGRIQHVGLRGDRSDLDRDGAGRQVIPVGPRPAFIEGVDIELLQFRAALAIAPDEVPAVYRAHELELIISNPWKVAIAGLVALEDDPTRRIRPQRVPFTLQPGETTRRPLTVVFDRAVAAGEQLIPATVTVESVDSERFEMHLPVTVGWKDVEITATWRIEPDAETGRRDLVIRQFVTNRGDEPVQLDAFLRGPGLTRQRWPLERLAPGATAVRTMRVPDGVRQLSGTVLRYGVRERGGPAQLNRPLPIPMLVPGGPGDAVTASVPVP